MASTSETGHATNVANAKLLHQQISALGAIYNPSNPKLALSNLIDNYEKGFMYQEKVNNSIAPYSLAVDERELVFAPKSKKITKIRKAYKATDGVTAAQMEDFMTISRKLKGTSKSKQTVSDDPEEEKANHSTSQMSYDYRTNNYDLLISLLENTPNYNPNEVEFQVATLKAEKAEMLEATRKVAETYIPLNSNRGLRNAHLYNNEDNLVDLHNKAKDYILSVLETKTVDYKAIARIKFRKPYRS